MKTVLLTLGAWLVAAPLAFPQTPLAAAELLRYSLDESAAQLTRSLGRPVQIADADPQFTSWYYQTDVADLHDFSHILLFSKSDGKLAGVTRNFHIPVTVDALFPAAKTQTYFWPSPSDPRWSVRVRFLAPDRIAIATGVKAPGESTTQVIIARRSALRTLLPWLESQLGAVETRIPAPPPRTRLH
jgi:hypothetical protein